MTIEDRLGSFPRQGPFRIKASFIPTKIFKGALWFLLFAGLGGGFGFYSLYLTSDLMISARVWKNGKEAAQTLGYRGKVRTTNLVLKSYDLKVHYRTLSGKRYIKRVEFFRFFTGPQKGDSYSVRYMVNNPKEAVFSWAYEARYHGWFFAALMFLIACLFLWGGYALSRSYLHDIFLIRRLAHKGEMILATFLHEETIRNEETGKVERLYQYSFQREQTYEAEYNETKDSEYPLFVNEGKHMVLLAGKSGKVHRVIRHDGYPLVL